PYPTYWPIFVKPGANYAESAITLGPALIFALFLLRKRFDWKTAGSIAVVGGVGLALAFGTFLNALLYFGIPGFAATGSPGRATIIFIIAACALAGLAVSRHIEPEEDEGKFAYWPLVALVFVF